MKYCDLIMQFYNSLNSDWEIPSGIELIYPFDPNVKGLMTRFYSQFFNDLDKRHFLFGINPGRLGAGMTGIPFTDPILLSEKCGIENDLDKKHELSSIFIYEMIDQMGGPTAFYSRFYISSLCPLGFLKENKNYNYYDSKELFASVEHRIVESINAQMKFPVHRDVAYSIGKGKNFKIFKDLNDQHGWFDKVLPLPHPRWVMQYRLREKDKHIQKYADNLGVV